MKTVTQKFVAMQLFALIAVASFPRYDALLAALPECTGNFKTAVLHAGMRLLPTDKVPRAEIQKKRKKQKLRTAQYGKQQSGAGTDADPLPVWIYGLVLLLGAILAALFFMY